MTAAALVAVVAVGAWAFKPASSSGPGSSSRTWGGPLANGSRLGYGQPVSAQRGYSYGDLDVRNEGTENVVLDRAWLVEKGRGLELLGMYVQGYPPKHPVGFIKGFRPSWGEPLVGWALAPGDAAQIVVGLSVSKPGKHTFDGVGLTYHVGRREYEWRIPVAVRLCAPAELYQGKCSPPSPTPSRLE